MEKKLATSPESLCKGFPLEFANYLNYCRNLKFEEKPDYEFLRKGFRELIKKEGWNNEAFDWEKGKKKESNENAKIAESKGNKDENKGKIEIKKEKEKEMVEENNIKIMAEVKKKIEDDKAKIEILKGNSQENKPNQEKIDPKERIKLPEREKMKENMRKMTKKDSFIEKNKAAFDQNKKDVLKSFQNTQTYLGPRIVVNKATYK